MAGALMLRMLRCLGHQHWIPRGRDLVIRFFANPDRMPFHPFSVPFFGQTYEGTLSDFIDWSVYFYGAYSRHELNLLADLCQAVGPDRQPNFIDAGANSGQHTLFMASRCARVDAFEPFPPVMATLKARLAANGIGNCHVHPVGLADREGTAAFIAPMGSNRGTGRFRLAPPEVGTEAGGAHPLKTVRGDEYLAAHGVPPTDILKIDVEGAEAVVLNGLSHRLRRDRPAVLMELSDRARRLFGTEVAFRTALYPDPVILSVHPLSVSGSYRLGTFDFQRSAELLVLPVEALDRWRGPLIERVSAFSTIA